MTATSRFLSFSIAAYAFARLHLFVMLSVAIKDVDNIPRSSPDAHYLQTAYFREKRKLKYATMAK